MFRNRIDVGSAVSPTPTPPPADAFVAWSPGCFFPITPEFFQWQQALYQWAHARACELLRPSLSERDWLGVWN